MNIAELKLELIKNICLIQDASLLEKIKQFLQEKDDYIQSEEAFSTANENVEKYENNSNLIEEEFHFFTPEQRKRVLNSLQKFKEGNTLTNEEAELDIQKWL